jgi:hypothetical protein
MFGGRLLSEVERRPDRLLTISIVAGRIDGSNFGRPSILAGRIS